MAKTEKTYEFLYNTVNRLIKIKRLERGLQNRPPQVRQVPQHR